MFGSIKKISSGDENVSKYVFENDTAVAEAVLYKYPTYKERTVICCSTQSGCPVGCRFCGAGDNFVRSLTSGEIIEQVRYLLAETGEKPADLGRLQVMFMSMGEPMLNFRALDEAIQILYRDYPRAALLISTSGPAVDYGPLIQLSQNVPTIGLQFSVHESTDEERGKLIPFKGKLGLESIADVGSRWYAETGRHPFFNYCVHGSNDSQEDVDRLSELFLPSVWQCTLSVICERQEHVAAANQRQRSLVGNFMDKMVARGYSARMFDPAGQDDIGCGQLWFVQEWMRVNPDKAKPSIGRGLPVVHCPPMVG